MKKRYFLKLLPALALIPFFKKKEEGGHYPIALPDRLETSTQIWKDGKGWVDKPMTLVDIRKLHELALKNRIEPIMYNGKPHYLFDHNTRRLVREMHDAL